MPQILHELQSILTQGEELDDDVVIVPVYPKLPQPRSRKATSAELQIKAALGSLTEHISGLGDVDLVSSIDFREVELAESFDAHDASTALAMGNLAALPDGQLAAIEAESDTDADAEPSGEVSDSGLGVPAVIEPVLGRVGNRSMRNVMRSLRALQAEQDAALQAILALEQAADTAKTAAAPIATDAVGSVDTVAQKRKRGPGKKGLKARTGSLLQGQLRIAATGSSAAADSVALAEGRERGREGREKRKRDENSLHSCCSLTLSEAPCVFVLRKGACQ